MVEGSDIVRGPFFSSGPRLLGLLELLGLLGPLWLLRRISIFGACHDVLSRRLGIVVAEEARVFLVSQAVVALPHNFFPDGWLSYTSCG